MLKNFFHRLSDFKSLEQTISIGITLLVFMCSFIYLYSCTDTTPASEEDIRELESKVMAITENPELLLSTDATIEISKEVTTYSIENKEASITAKYDKDYNLIEKNIKDKSFSKLGGGLICLCVSLIISISVYALTAIFVYITIGLLRITIEERRKSSKKPR